MQRNTRQRAAIFQVFEEQRRPLSAEEVLRHAQEKVPGLGIATVYRTLNAFKEMRHLRAFDMPGKGVYYELAEDGRTHLLLCEKCERMFALDTPVPPPVVKGYAIVRCEVFSFGECPECGHE